MQLDKFNRIVFSSLTCEWDTPLAIYQAMVEEFGQFDLDVCASSSNSKGKEFYSATDLFSGLAKPWVGNVWMNPPFGKTIGKWVSRAYESGQQGARVVCLLPSRTDTKWWHDYCMKSNDIRFIKGRLKFGGAIYNAPFPSVIVIFGGEETDG